MGRQTWVGDEHWEGREAPFEKRRFYPTVVPFPFVKKKDERLPLTSQRLIIIILLEHAYLLN